MYNIILRMSPIVWWNFLIIAFDCEFFTVVGTLWMPNCLSRAWNSQPVNSPPLLCTPLVGQWYLDSQQFEDYCATWTIYLSLICVISSRLVTGSIVVKTLKTNSLPWMVLFYGSMKSTAHSVHTTSRACLGARWPYGLPLFLYMLQLSERQYCWHSMDRLGW